MAVAIHPAVDHGVQPGAQSFAGGTLVCQCADRPVKVRVASQSAHNHVCGCTKCWKPEGALFSIVAVVPRDKVRVNRTAEAEDRRSLGDNSALRLHGAAACTCMAGSKTRDIRSMVSISSIPNCPARAGLVGAGVRRFRVVRDRAGTKPDQMSGIRARLRELRLEPYDCLSPQLMDAIATHIAKAKGVLH